MMEILMGADPEFFVKDQFGRFRSAHGLVPGTKEEPFKVPKGAIQVDGMALEFNIDPAATEDEFVTNISTVIGEMRKAVPDRFSFEFVPSVKFHGNHMRAQPEAATEMGCQPDFDSYTMADNPRPNGATTLRTASGHIHIGFCDGADPLDPDHIRRCAVLAKHLDLFLGIRSLEWDTDQTRRTLYGKAGAIRIKPYGLEYRVLSNAWLKDEKLVRFVYKQTKACIADLMAGGRCDDALYANVKRFVEGNYSPACLRFGYIPKSVLNKIRELQI